MSGYDISVLRQKLTRGGTHSKSSNDELLMVLQEVCLQLHSLPPNENQEILYEIVQLLTNNDIRIKKLVYVCLSMFAQNNGEILLHCMNGLKNDIACPNPMIRAAVVHLLPDFYRTKLNRTAVDFVRDGILRSLQDTDVWVRQAAVQAAWEINSVAKVENVEGWTAGSEKISQLLQSDPEPAVVVGCAHCIADIEPSHRILHPSLVLLLQRAKILDAWLAVSLMSFGATALDLAKLEDNTKLKLLNQVDSMKRLQIDLALPIETYGFMSTLSRGMGQVNKAVLEQFTEALVTAYNSSQPDVKTVILSCLLSMLAGEHKFLVAKFLRAHFQCFLLCYGDSEQVKLTKLSILEACADNDIASAIFANIKRYLYVHPNNCMAKVSTGAFSVLLRLYTFMPDRSYKVVSCLLQSSSLFVAKQAVTCLAAMVMKKLQNGSEVGDVPERNLQILLDLMEKADDDINLKCTCIWLLSFTNDATSCSSIARTLKQEIASLKSTSSTSLQFAILNSTLRLFCKFPNVFCHHVKTLYNHVALLPSGCVKDQAQVYLRLLKTDVKHLESIINNFKCQNVDKDVSGNNNTVCNSLKAIASTVNMR